MRAWMILATLGFLAGCTQQTTMDTKSAAQLQATIPANIVEQYGLLQLEREVNDVERIEHQNGAVSLLLEPQQTAQLKQKAQELFAQYEQAIAQKSNQQITDITYDAAYKTIHFTVKNEAVIYDEEFVLAEEVLVKQALAYQLIQGEPLGVTLYYYEDAGERVLSKKTVPLQLSALD